MNAKQIDEIKATLTRKIQWGLESLNYQDREYYVQWSVIDACAYLYIMTGEDYVLYRFGVITHPSSGDLFCTMSNPIIHEDINDVRLEWNIKAGNGYERVTLHG